MITLADLKSYIGLTATTAEEDALLLQLEAAAVAHLERSTGRYFGPPALFTWYVPGSGRSTLWLPEAPVEGTDVLAAARWFAGQIGTLLDDVTVRGRQLVRGSFWQLGAEYEVEAIAGYGAGSGETAGITGSDVPADVWRAVAEIVKASWQSRTTNEAMKSETISGYSYTRADGGGELAIPVFAQGVINNWKRARI